MNLVPVDGNPFGEDQPSGKTKLVPVEGNPFAQSVQPDAFMRGAAGVAQDMNPLQALMVGAGRGFSQVGAGAQQVYNYLTGNDQGDLAAKQKEADAIYKPMQQAHPLASGVGEYLPSFALPVGASASVLGAMGRMALPGMIQAAASYGSPEDRLKEAALQGAGGAVGGGLTSALGKVISPAIKAATPEVDQLAQLAAKSGINLNPAQLSGGKFAQGIQSALDTIPWTVGGQQAAKDAQQSAFNAALLAKGVGADAAKASPDVLADAAANIGAKFQSSVAGVNVPLNQTATAMIDQVANKYAQRLDSMQKPIVANIADDLKAAGPTLTGEQYHSFVSDIATAARNVTDKPTQTALKSLRSALDNSFKAAAPADQQAAYFEARSQWKNLLTIEDAMKNARSQGDIPAKQFYASMQKMTPNFVRGQGGEVGDLARMGRQFLPDPIANSGTPFRGAFTNLLSAGTMGGLGAGGSALAGGDPMEGLKLGLLGYGVSKGGQRLFNSVYPTNQLLPDELKRILSRSGGLLGTGATAAAAANQ